MISYRGRNLLLWMDIAGTNGMKRGRMTDEVERVLCAVQLITDRRSVHWISRSDWEPLVRSDGQPTIVESCFLLASVSKDVQVVIAAASGIINNDPGMDIVRLDLPDTPRIYNVDHYTVIEDLVSHPSFGDVVRVAGLEPVKELCTEVAQYVYLVSPDKSQPHQFEVIPEHIRTTRRQSGASH